MEDRACPEAAELRYYDIEAYDRRRRRIRLRATIAIAVAVAIVLAVIGGLQWWEQVRPPSIGAYADSEITITGLGKQFSVTPQELLEMDCVWDSTTSKSGKSASGTSVSKTAEVYGPTFETFLAHYGYEMSDFSKIKIVCKDDYYVILRPQKEEVDAVLSIANGKSALLDKQQPLRFILLSAESSRWAYGVVEIQFTKMKTASDNADEESSGGEESSSVSDLPEVLLSGGKE